MVLEQLYPASWIERKTSFAFVMAVSYAVIGIASAVFLFPEDPGLVAVAFISLLLLPTLNRMLSIEQKQAAMEEKFDLTDPFKNHTDIFSVYLFMFLGVFITFAFFSIVLPSIAASKLFEQQINILGLVGSATGFGGFASIFSNNLKVFLFCLVFSFVYGGGAIFIIVWNASVWGSVFGIIAKNAALITSANPIAYFAITVLMVSPHMITEAASYLMVAISGGIMSKATLKEKLFSDRFTKTVQDGLVIFGVALILLIIAAYVEVNFTGKAISSILVR